MAKEMVTTPTDEEEFSPLLVQPTNDQIIFGSVGEHGYAPLGLEAYASDFLNQAVAIMSPVIGDFPHIHVKLSHVRADEYGHETILDDSNFSRFGTRTFGTTNLKTGDVTIYVPIYDVESPQLRGVADIVSSALVDDDRFIQFAGLWESWPRSALPFESGLDCSTVITLLLSGEVDQIPYFPIRRRNQERVQRQFAAWLNTYVRMNKAETTFYTAITAHELHHTAFENRAIEQHVFSGRRDLDFADEILQLYDENIQLFGSSKEMDFLIRLQDMNPFSYHRYMSKIFGRVIHGEAQPEAMYNELMKYRVFYGCDEAIATLVTQTLLLRMPGYHFSLENLPNGYSPVLLVLPPQEMLRRWEETLMVEPEELGMALNSIYDELLTKGGFEKLYTRALQR